ncbi:hypothetical protein [Blastopirellula marina]|uniref:Uncharacterized protein n=1 Tax=Blastopirellula marina TaxID=124 RepID=A0A2S8F9V3_9BACT|nr:hypothetical protein [Blastopirellula marina]PQO28946.1 hypothetical protein C5Y98_24620 [Blastopirellula marina]PTL42219.1 hypothetical protein C5Y97_24635 [Blastopirellula marina]
MTQNEIVSAVARVTGEDVSEIRRRGFSIVEPYSMKDELDAENSSFPSQAIDWDGADLGQPSPIAAELDALFC